MTASTNKKSGQPKGKAARSTKVVGGPPSLAKLEAAAARKPAMIRPKYRQFDTPTTEGVTIQKISIGKRDEINAMATDSNGELDASLMCQAAVAESLIYPKLTFDQVPNMDPEDFSLVWHEVNELSYRKVGEVVSQFLSKNGGS